MVQKMKDMKTKSEDKTDWSRSRKMLDKVKRHLHRKWLRTGGVGAIKELYQLNAE